MIKKQVYMLFLSLIFSFTAMAQTYGTQYKICSEPLSKLTLVDSLYFALAQKRDSCLLGVTAPNFQATTLDNKRIDLSKLKGQVVVLNFGLPAASHVLRKCPVLIN